MADLSPWHRIGGGSATALDLAAALSQVEGETPLAAPERLVVAGDWHGEVRWATHVLEVAAAAGARTVLQLGDFGMWPGGEEYLDRLSDVCTEQDLAVVWIDGNHEDFDQLERYPLVGGVRPVRPRVWHLPRGTRWEWGGTKWLAAGGATSLDRAVRTPGASWWPQEQLTDREVEEISAAGHADVLVTHDCPATVDHYFGPPPSFWALEDLAVADVHRERVQRLVDAVQPGHLLHGHLHRGYQRHLQVPWGDLVVTGLDCNGSSSGHAVVLEPAEPGTLEHLEV